MFRLLGSRFSVRVQVLLFGILLGAGSVSRVAAQGTDALNVNDIVEKMKQPEQTLITNLGMWKPIIEVYIQNLEPDDQSGFVPVQDSYFLGRFEWDKAPKMLQLTGTKEAAKKRFDVMKAFGLEFFPDGFASMIVPDWDLLDTKRYEFKIVRREFVGEARCFVIDVKPAKKATEGFSGRIWVEDRGYNIIRYNGINRRVEKSLFKTKVPVHMDGWRVNVQPGLWLPSYLYVEETDLEGATGNKRTARFKSQVKLWGFDPKRAEGQGQFTGIDIIEPDVKDNAAAPKQFSPVDSQRRWEQEAEANVIERLQQSSLLAPASNVEKILETVINNLIVTNNIEVDAPVKARVLLTSPLESFTIGHTIVLSRGLIDVLPDEASLAMMLAHELSHIVLGHKLIDTQFAFVDRMMVTDDNLLRVLKVARTPQEEEAADNKVMEMLKKSPYADKLADAGLFLRIVAERSKHLQNLIQPHIGDHLVDQGTPGRMSAIMAAAPQLDQNNLDQIAALPLGARLILDPWTSTLELSRAATPELRSVREKVPFAVTPLMPYIRYAEAATSK